MAGRSVARIIQVPIGLSIAGGVVGGVLGAMLLAVMLVVGGGVRDIGNVVPIGSIFGAAMGAVLAPIAAWTLMRNVPIWRAIAETAVGTMVGAGIGMSFQPMYHSAWLSPAILGVAGFALAALRLRLKSRGRARVAASGE
jgi:hypothetical protein